MRHESGGKGVNDLTSRWGISLDFLNRRDKKYWGYRLVTLQREQARSALVRVLTPGPEGGLNTT